MTGKVHAGGRNVECVVTSTEREFKEFQVKVRTLVLFVKPLKATVIHADLQHWLAA